MTNQTAVPVLVIEKFSQQFLTRVMHIIPGLGCFMFSTSDVDVRCVMWWSFYRADLRD